jgi:hypothetical protein
MNLLIIMNQEEVYLLKNLMLTRSWDFFVESFRAGAYAPARKLSTNLYDIYHYWVYSE